MYTQSFNVPDADAKSGTPLKAVPHDTALQAHFDAAIDADGKIEPRDWMPEDRERIAAGRLEITEIVDDPEGGEHIEVFDPTRVPDGIELSDDPILHARARAYSVSAYRRLGMDVENPSTPPAH